MKKKYLLLILLLLMFSVNVNAASISLEVVSEASVDVNVSVYKLDADVLCDNNKCFNDYVKDNNLVAVFKGKTKDKKVSVSNLKNGKYLVLSSDLKYEFTGVKLDIPYVGEDGVAREDVTLYPKLTKLPGASDDDNKEDQPGKPSDDKDPNKDIDKLPQTGITHNEIYYCIIFGALLIAGGLVLRIKK